MQKQLATGMVLAFVCLPAMAESEAGFYTGVGVGWVTLKDNIGGAKLEGSDTGFKLFGGYRFNQYGSLEIAYLDAGKPDDTVSGVRVESDATAIQGSALLQIPIAARFEGFVRAGFVAWDAKNTVRDSQSAVTYKNDGTDWSLGIGATFHITPSFGLRAEYEGAELDGTDLRALSLGGMYRF